MKTASEYRKRLEEEVSVMQEVVARHRAQIEVCRAETNKLSIITNQMVAVKHKLKVLAEQFAAAVKEEAEIETIAENVDPTNNFWNTLP